MHTKRYPSRNRVWSLSLCLIAALGLGESAAQTSLGHRQLGNRIIIDQADHWRHWTGPTHVVDVLPDGSFKPHFFRHVYDIIAEDRESFAQPVDAPGIRKDDQAIMNLNRTPVLESDGSFKTSKAEKVSKFLDRDFKRFPNNVSHIPINGLQKING